MVGWPEDLQFLISSRRYLTDLFRWISQNRFPRRKEAELSTSLELGRLYLHEMESASGLGQCSAKYTTFSWRSTHC